MFFDVKAALSKIENHIGPPATSATFATPEQNSTDQVANVAGVAGHLRVVRKSDAPRQVASSPAVTPDIADPETLLTLLHRDGPTGYGAAATVLGWGATRAWQAEAKLRAKGLVHHDALGRACPTEEGANP